MALNAPMFLELPKIPNTLSSLNIIYKKLVVRLIFAFAKNLHLFKFTASGMFLTFQKIDNSNLVS